MTTGVEARSGACPTELHSLAPHHQWAGCGYSLVEVMFTLTLGVVVGAIAVPQVLANVDDTRASGAVHYLTTKLNQARMEAVARSRDVGLQFVAVGGAYSYTVYSDGNADGIRTRDIQSGSDARIAAPEHLPDRFTGVDFGVLPGLPAVDSSSTPPGSDPIKLGSSNILTFTALGTSSTGSLYVRSRGGAQWVIRVTGETGKVRVLKYDPRLRQWKP